MIRGYEEHKSDRESWLDYFINDPKAEKKPTEDREKFKREQEEERRKPDR